MCMAGFFFFFFFFLIMFFLLFLLFLTFFIAFLLFGLQLCLNCTYIYNKINTFFPHLEKFHIGDISELPREAVIQVLGALTLTRAFFFRVYWVAAFVNDVARDIAFGPI